MTIYDQFIRPGDLVFDVGAHLGRKTDEFLTWQARVVAIEPQRALADDLAVRLRGKATVVCSAATDHDGPVTLAVCEQANALSTIVPGLWSSGRFKGYVWDRRVRVIGRTLDSFIAEYGEPAFIKVDVEGAERLVLAGLTHAVRGISWEFTQEFPAEIERCVHTLDHLAPYLFNYVMGEAEEYVLPEWQAADVFLASIEADLTPELWGNVYARRIDG